MSNKDKESSTSRAKGGTTPDETSSQSLSLKERHLDSSKSEDPFVKLAEDLPSTEKGRQAGEEETDVHIPDVVKHLRERFGILAPALEPYVYRSGLVNSSVEDMYRYFYMRYEIIVENLLKQVPQPIYRSQLESMLSSILINEFNEETPLYVECISHMANDAILFTSLLDIATLTTLVKCAENYINETRSTKTYDADLPTQNSVRTVRKGNSHRDYRQTVTEGSEWQKSYRAQYIDPTSSNVDKGSNVEKGSTKEFSAAETEQDLRDVPGRAKIHGSTNASLQKLPFIDQVVDPQITYAATTTVTTHFANKDNISSQTTFMTNQSSSAVLQTSTESSSVSNTPHLSASSPNRLTTHLKPYPMHHHFIGNNPSPVPLATPSSAPVGQLNPMTTYSTTASVPSSMSNMSHLTSPSQQHIPQKINSSSETVLKGPPQHRHAIMVHHHHYLSFTSLETSNPAPQVSKQVSVTHIQQNSPILPATVSATPPVTSSQASVQEMITRAVDPPRTSSNIPVPLSVQQEQQRQQQQQQLQSGVSISANRTATSNGLRFGPPVHHHHYIALNHRSNQPLTPINTTLQQQKPPPPQQLLPQQQLDLSASNEDHHPLERPTPLVGSPMPSTFHSAMTSLPKHALVTNGNSGSAQELCVSSASCPKNSALIPQPAKVLDKTLHQQFCFDSRPLAPEASPQSTPVQQQPTGMDVEDEEDVQQPTTWASSLQPSFTSPQLNEQEELRNILMSGNINEGVIISILAMGKSVKELSDMSYSVFEEMLRKFVKTVLIRQRIRGLITSYSQQLRKTSPSETSPNKDSQDLKNFMQKNSITTAGFEVNAEGGMLRRPPPTPNPQILPPRKGLQLPQPRTMALQKQFNSSNQISNEPGTATPMNDPSISSMELENSRREVKGVGSPQSVSITQGLQQSGYRNRAEDGEEEKGRRGTGKRMNGRGVNSMYGRGGGGRGSGRGFRESDENTVCWFYSKPDGCHFGDGCRFLHINH